MAEVIILAKHRRLTNDKSETKICAGCEKKLPLKKFPNHGGRFCKSCANENMKVKYNFKKKEREIWSI